jgi:hypothetical protein
MKNLPETVPLRLKNTEFSILSVARKNDNCYSISAALKGTIIPKNIRCQTGG